MVDTQRIEWWKNVVGGLILFLAAMGLFTTIGWLTVGVC